MQANPAFLQTEKRRCKKNSAQGVEISCFWEILTLFYARSQK